MDAKLRYFLLTAEYIMLENQIKYLYSSEKEEERREHLMHNQNVIRAEIQRIIDSSIHKALEQEPDGLQKIYKELGI